MKTLITALGITLLFATSANATCWLPQDIFDDQQQYEYRQCKMVEEQLERLERFERERQMERTRLFWEDLSDDNDLSANNFRKQLRRDLGF